MSATVRVIGSSSAEVRIGPPAPTIPGCPLGSGLIFADFDGSGNIWNVQPNGTGLTQVTTSGDDQASWSPDNTKLAIYRDPDIIITCSDGTNPVTVFSGAGSAWPQTQPRWSADGTLIYTVYTTIHASSQGAGIVAIHADGSGSSLIPITVPNISGHTVGVVDASGDPAFTGPSPDGTKLAFGVLYTSPTVTNPYLAISAIDGSGVAVMSAIQPGAQGTYAQDWYSDNTHILAQYTTTGPTGTEIVKIDTGADTMAVLHADSGSGDAFRGCALSPDQSQIAFCGPNPGDLVTMPAAGGALTTVLAYNVSVGTAQPGLVDW